MKAFKWKNPFVVWSNGGCCAERISLLCHRVFIASHCFMFRSKMCWKRTEGISLLINQQYSTEIELYRNTYRENGSMFYLTFWIFYLSYWQAKVVPAFWHSTSPNYGWILYFDKLWNGYILWDLFVKGSVLGRGLHGGLLLVREYGLPRWGRVNVVSDGLRGFLGSALQPVQPINQGEDWAQGASRTAWE